MALQYVALLVTATGYALSDRVHWIDHMPLLTSVKI